MRQSTLQTLGLGNVIDIFKNGTLPANTSELADQVFGAAGSRKSMIISGANGIVGAGKLMQFGSRLLPYDVPIIGLDLAGAPDGITAQYQGLEAAFGRKQAAEIMANIVQMNYDGKNLPGHLKKMNPGFLLEAIPEILELKKSHYAVFRESFPDINIRSVTSGFPSSELGVGIAHPAFPHQINKIFEIVEDEPSAVTKLLWAMGLMPIPVSDNWSFVLDVLFCGITLSALRYHEQKNMPFWKMDKYVRKLFGPNPFRAHDVIGAKGANFLTWSCLNDLSKHYGSLFTPTKELVNHKDSGQNWYPLNHLRPVVNWTLDEEELIDIRDWVLGSLIRMTAVMLHENRAHLAHMNAIGELCAQFRQGALVTIRSIGAEDAVRIGEKYQELYPRVKDTSWYPEVFNEIESAEWQQLYVNAEHDGNVGVITISRESYNKDVDDEMNRAIDWLKNDKIERVIVTGDFHMSTQMVGADTSEFYPALHDKNAGFIISNSWSKTARRLNNEFRASVGFINGKRCLGGMLELMVHCHYLVAVEDAKLGVPEVTLPVVPGMEFCHWSFRKAKREDWNKILYMLLSGEQVPAGQAVGWLLDYAGPMENSLKMTWEIANDGEKAMPKRPLVEDSLSELASVEVNLPETDNPMVKAARKAIADCVIHSCEAPLTEAIDIQSEHSAKFMTTKECLGGMIGGDYKKTMEV